MRVAFLVNGAEHSAAGVRAARVAAALGATAASVNCREGSRGADARRFVRAARGADAVYAVDLASAPLLGAAFRHRAVPLVVDAGDAPAAFFRVVHAPVATIAAADLMERYAYRAADAFVVRGYRHPQYLRTHRYQGPVHVVPDGVDTQVFSRVDDAGLRGHLGLGGTFTVGISGYFTWHAKLGGGLGWELLHALARLPAWVHAVFIGTGPGLPRLRELAVGLGVHDRVHSVGQVAYDALPRHLALCDVCLLTQTNDLASQIRTTGKLPVYMAAGRYVLATRVGTAAEVLPDEMLLDYHGSWDRSYPERLADAIVRVADDPSRRDKGWALREVAAALFDYRKVAEAGAAVIRGLLT